MGSLVSHKCACSCKAVICVCLGLQGCYSLAKRAEEGGERLACVGREVDVTQS